MKINELRQRMNVAVSTFYRLFGYMPSVEELKDELGSEFAPVLATYSGVQCRADLRL
ncbi:MAG: hypothetical protein MR671_03630 [Clostridiales bacterium]|uniref:hypothetical protein n=1 Tax=Chordicoccus furentiruminis TaxID=2709410 RepID=UPI0023A82B7C|nr:hypothetical protein [Chordicoccus furentiruminis]MCI6173334.1 hypothetical protein [Clostridiales bacterium]